MTVDAINGKDGHVRCGRCFGEMTPNMVGMVGYPRPLLFWRCKSEVCGALTAVVPLPEGLVRRMLRTPMIQRWKR